MAQVERSPEEGMMVIVPDADDMDDDVFLMHVDKRHKGDTGVEDVVLHKLPHIQQAWVGSYRAFHDYMHKVNEYDHEHIWDDEEDDREGTDD